jgi:sugar phosphate isomerase/epimerase
MRNQLAVQLFTLREECKADFPKVLRQMKEMGWAGVQMAGYHGYDPAELAALITELGMQTAGLHIGFNDLIGNLEQAVRDAELFQTKDLVCSSPPPDKRDEEGYRMIKRALNEAAAAVQEKGLRLSYHNHAFEFDVTVDGISALEHILEPSESNLILAEPDVYWVKKGGRDIVPFLEGYANRMPIIHLKDMTTDEHQVFAEIGTGSIDFLPILRFGAVSGVEWYVVEQDRCAGNPLDCVQTSFNNLTRLIGEL